jgi:limonene-1,2-epoxide hydrolase
VFEVEDGKIRYWQEHYDVAALERMFAGDIPVTERDPATT